MFDVPSVLVVDNDASTQGLLVAVLKHLGLKPRIAGDGREALEIIAAEDPAAILLDLLMPEVDGFQILRALGTTSPHMLRRVIVVTAAMGHQVDDCRELEQVWGHFRKPMDVDQLSASLIACLAASEADAGRGRTHGVMRRT
jgi:CheY-like chemotaxis protein